MHSHPPIRRTVLCLGLLSPTPQWQANSWPERRPGRDDREATGCSFLWSGGTDEGHLIPGPNIRMVDSRRESPPPHPAEIANWGRPKCPQNGAAIRWTYWACQWKSGDKSSAYGAALSGPSGEQSRRHPASSFSRCVDATRVVSRTWLPYSSAWRKYLSVSPVNSAMSHPAHILPQQHTPAPESCILAEAMELPVARSWDERHRWMQPWSPLASAQVLWGLVDCPKFPGIRSWTQPKRWNRFLGSSAAACSHSTFPVGYTSGDQPSS